MKKNLYIGGYSILDLADANVYAQALICAKQNKPVLVYDNPERYFADTITIDTDNDDNVVITKGGKTITITDANSVSSEGTIQYIASKLFRHFISITTAEASGGYITIDIICDKDTAFTLETLYEYGNTIGEKYINANGVFSAYNIKNIKAVIFKEDSLYLFGDNGGTSYGDSTYALNSGNFSNFRDVFYQL